MQPLPTGYIRTSVMCETVANTDAAVESHWPIFHYVSKFYLENQQMVLSIENVGKRNVHCIATPVRLYLEIGGTGPIEWTLALQDPLHRKEQETGINLSVDQEGQIFFESCQLVILSE